MDPTLSWGPFLESPGNLSGPVKFPGKLPDKLTGPEITGTFEKRAPGTDHFCSHGTVPLINVRPHGTGLLWFGKKSNCFYQLSKRRIHVEAFKMAPKKAKSIRKEIKPSAGRTLNYPFS